MSSSDTASLKTKAPFTRVVLRDVVVGIALFCAVLTLYWPTLKFDFVSYDDLEYVVDAFHVQQGLSWPGLHWAMTTLKTGSWLPLTWLSLMLDRQIFGADAWGFHLTNILLHAANTLLLFLVLSRMTARWKPTAAVAILFAVHPLRVESVAWIAERKDVLSLFFALWMLLCYHWYITRPNAWRYLGTLFFFILSLASKSMLVTAPCLLLLLDFWPLRRFELAIPTRENRRTLPRLLLEKVPFVVISIAICIVTYIGQRRAGAVSSDDSLSITERLVNVPISYVRYMAKMVWFEKLAVIYPYIRNWPTEQIVGSTLLLVMITLTAWFIRKKHPHLLVGWLWYLGLLVPVIGLIQVGSQSIADRYTYLPTIGLFIMLAWLVDDVCRVAHSRWQSPRVTNTLVLLLFSAIVLWLCFFTRRQLNHWQNSFTLFDHAIKVTENNAIAHSNLGMIFVQQGNRAQGLSHMRQAIAINPNYPQARTNLGAIYMSMGQLDLAAKEYEWAIENMPNAPQPRSNMAIVLQSRGDLAGAEKLLRKALEIDPEFSDAHNNLGNLLSARGQLEEAVVEFKKAVQYHAKSPKALTNLGITLGKLNQDEQALAAFRQAMRQAPGLLEPRLGAANLLLQRNRLEEALEYLRQCLPLSPGDVRLRLSIGSVLCQLHRPQEALGLLRQAVALGPQAAMTHGSLGEALVEAEQVEQGLEELQKAVALEPNNPQWKQSLDRAMSLSPKP